MAKEIQKHLYAAIAIIVVVFAVFFLTFWKPNQALSQSQTTVPINGYAWSDDIGWVDLNCVNSHVCATNPFGLAINSNGQLSGYAWSDNIGWISANQSDLTGCPNTPCTATISTSTGAMSGWLKAIGADNNGWDGWVRLSGSNYGVTLSGGAFSGDAWDDVTTGWINFSYATTTYGTCTPVYTCSGNSIIYTAQSCVQSTIATCVSPGFCSAGSSSCLVPQMVFTPFTPTGSLPPSGSGQLQIQPRVLLAGKTARVYWNVSNAQSCTVTGTNGDRWTATYSGAAGEQTSPIAAQTTYTLSCTGYSGAAPPSVSEAQTITLTPIFQEK